MSDDMWLRCTAFLGIFGERKTSTDVIGVGASGSASPAGTLCSNLARSKRWSMVAVPLVPAVGN